MPFAHLGMPFTIKNSDMGKDVFGINANSKEAAQPAEIFNMIRKFALFSYVLQYQMIL